MSVNALTRWTAARAAVLLSAFFLLVYGATNHYTSLRGDVGVWAFSWERHIPFVPFMIIPYLSLDLLFVAAPFLCTERDELRLLARRIVLAVSLAAVCYLVIPLRFSFERPHAPGVLGVVFDWFRGMDRPYNQLPSLHIALRTILAELYDRHTRGWKRAASHVWFGLVGASTLLTYQHHVVDVVGGLILAGACFYLVSDRPWRLPVTRNLRIGGCYAIGAAACVAVAVLAWPWTAILLWPAVGLTIAAAAYAGVGPGVFRKQRGALPMRTRMIFAPVLFGQWLSLRYYARRSGRWNVVTPNVWIGRTLTRRESVEARAAGVTAVLDLTGELAEPYPLRAIDHYRNVPILDLTAPTRAQLDEAVAFVDQQVRAGRIVYVHCKAGYSRSAVVVAAYLIRAGHADSPAAALDLIRKRRRGIIVREEAMDALARRGVLA
jgi:protein-tyrosine phosphatase